VRSIFDSLAWTGQSNSGRCNLPTNPPSDLVL
jgi:hypothetical protein